jgi:DNA invertase Pin-like site-specific DNA recombinase
MFQMLGVFSEFERSMISERVNAGLARARAQGKTLGRPRSPAIEKAILEALARGGKGMQKIAKEFCVDIGCAKACQRLKQVNRFFKPLTGAGNRQKQSGAEVLLTPSTPTKTI